MAVAVNALARPLNLIEQSRALRLLSKHCPDKRLFTQSAATAGLPDNPVMIEKLLSLDGIAPVIRQGIFTGCCTEKV